MTEAVTKKAEKTKKQPLPVKAESAAPKKPAETKKQSLPVKAESSAPKKPAETKKQPSPVKVESVAPKKKKNRPLRPRSPGVSRGEIKMDLVLNTVYSQRTFDKSWNRTCGALYKLSKVLPEIVIEQPAVIDQIDILNHYLNERMDIAIDDLKSRIAQIEQLLEQRGFSGVEADFSLPTKHSISITTPRILRLKSVFETLDSLHKRIHTAWSLELMDDGQTRNATNLVNQGVKKMCTHFIAVEKHIFANIQDVKAGRANIDLERLRNMVNTHM